MSRPATDEEDDAALVRRAQGGEFGAFDMLVSRYERRLYGLALSILRHRQDAEDVVQETFLNAMAHLGTFRADAPFRSWLFRIATNAGLRVLRRRTRMPTVPLEPADRPESLAGLARPDFIAQWSADPAQLAERPDTARVIDEALAELDDKYRLVFLLRDVNGLSVRETAHAAGISEANVKVRLLRARLKLREKLTRAFGDPATRLDPPADHRDGSEERR